MKHIFEYLFSKKSDLDKIGSKFIIVTVHTDADDKLFNDIDYLHRYRNGEIIYIGENRYLESLKDIFREYFGHPYINSPGLYIASGFKSIADIISYVRKHGNHELISDKCKAIYV